MKALLLCLILLLPAALRAEEKVWSTTELSLLAAYQVARFVDWRQTLNIAEQRNPDGSYAWHETNPLLGRHPSVGRVNTHYAISAIGVAALAHYLPNRYRKPFLTGAVVFEVAIVARNYNLGIAMRW